MNPSTHPSINPSTHRPLNQNFDALTLAAIADELRATLLGGRVQDVLPRDPWCVGLELYAHTTHQRHYLLLNADARAPRVLLASSRLRRGDADAVTPLVLRLRKLLEGAHLDGVEQPPYERVLALVFDPHAGPPVTLVVECMERRANLILVEGVPGSAAGGHVAGMVLECARRVGPEINRARVTLPGHPYVPPPPQAKRDPAALSDEDLGALLVSTAGPAWRALVAGLRGLSPLAAREAVFRASGASDTPATQLVERSSRAALRAALAGLLAPLHTRQHAWEPTLAIEPAAGAVDRADSAARDGEAAVTADDTPPDGRPGAEPAEPVPGRVVAFAPYLLTHLGGSSRVVRVESMSAAVERYDASLAEASGADAADAYAARKQRVRERLGQAGVRLAGKRDALARELAQAEQIEAWRVSGELILAYAYAIRPGQRELRAAYAEGEPERVIALDPERTPVQNAQDYFKRYEKAKSAAHDLPARLARVEADRAYLAQLQSDLDLADSAPAIDEVGQALDATGWLDEPASRRGRAPRHVPRSAPLRFISAEGFVIWVGRNARQNDELTFTRARPDDVWLHVRDAPGAHVVIASGGRAVPEATLRQAAELAAWHSARRGEGAVAVAFAPRKAVRRVPGGRPGMVTVRGEQTLTVSGRKGPEQ